MIALCEGGLTEADVLVHDETNRQMAMMLAQMEAPTMPVAVGVLYCNPAETYEHAVRVQEESATNAATIRDINALLRRGATWEVGR